MIRVRYLYNGYELADGSGPNIPTPCIGEHIEFKGTDFGTYEITMVTYSIEHQQGETLAIIDLKKLF